jgi:hypothetical protein
MMEERQMALPKLYGAPAYRPPRRVLESPKPFDPDDMPLTAERTEDEQALIQALPERAFAPGGGIVLASGEPPAPATTEDAPRRRGIARLFGRN